MDRRQMKDAFEGLSPTEEQTQKMWNSVVENSAPIYQKKKSARKRIHKVTAAAAILLVITVCGIGINVAADGDLLAVLTKAVGINEASEEIIEQAKAIPDHGMEMNAPDIISIDENILVFGTLRGMLIYDLHKKEFIGTIDTQAIDCIYFKGETKQSHVIRKENSLILFNSENGVPYGPYYRFDLVEGEELELPPSMTGDDDTLLMSYYKEWQKQEKKYVNTYEQFEQDGIEKEVKESAGRMMYSQRSLNWTDNSGTEYLSYLTIEKNWYILNNYNKKTASYTTETIQFASVLTETDTKATLPDFVYTGNNLAVKEICEYLRQENTAQMLAGEVWVPAFLIFKEVEKGDETLIFGNFWSFTYLQSGNILETQSGGEMPACFHLKKTGNSYEVTSVDTAGDGAMYGEDIKKFTKGYNGLFEQYMDYSEEEKEAACKEYLRMYVKESGLLIKYYKRFGWDPVELF